MLVFVLLNETFWEMLKSPVGIIISFLIALIIVLIIIAIVTKRPISVALGKSNFSIGVREKEEKSSQELEQRITQIETQLTQDAKKLELLFDQLEDMPDLKDKLNVLRGELEEYNVEIYAWKDIGKWLEKNRLTIVKRSVKNICALQENKSHMTKNTPRELRKAYDQILEYLEKNYKTLRTFDETEVAEFINEKITLKGRSTILFPQLFAATIDFIKSEEKKKKLSLSNEAKKELLNILGAFEEEVSSLLPT